ncbi:MAG: hypothetical protein ABR964_01065 [Tepidisphaeraceae bacterium]|jgi:pimeloyl-ACP methyl ester carboxylesterase
MIATRKGLRSLAGGGMMACLLLACGCASRVIAPDAPNTVIVVPGIGGDADEYTTACRALADAGSRDCLQVFDWGLKWPLFFLTISWPDLHEHTEIKLAALITRWRAAHPQSRIVLIGHSAGAGVILGALARLDDRVGEVGPVILLAPAVSPDYQLKPALGHVRVIHVFYNKDDDFWQGIGPAIFGNYDGAHRNGAGKRGFTLTGLDADQRTKVIQHPYQKEWDKLGQHGGHFDWLAHDFVARVLMPLVDGTAPTADAARTSPLPPGSW